MLIDHIGAVIIMDIMPYPWLYTRHIGRVAFPIFAYLTANGCMHTKSINKYMLRLGIFALVSQIPFDMAFNAGEINFLWDTNIFYTLFLGVVSVAVYNKLRRTIGQGLIWKLLPVIAVAPFAAAAQLLGTDYGATGVTLIFMLYITNPVNKILRSIVLILGMVLLYGIHDIRYNALLLSFSMIAVILILFYNGKQGPQAQSLKHGFYAFYPIHLIALAIAATVL